MRLTAPEVVVRDQPNSRSIGSMSTPVEDRKAAAATSAARVIAATKHARRANTGAGAAGCVIRR